MIADDWIIGVEGEHGMDVIRGPGGGGINPSTIHTVYFPVSLPWSDSAEIVEGDLTAVESNERSMGAEVTHSARHENSTPDDDTWYIKVDLWEYPSGAFNNSELEHSENITPAIWTEEDLIDRIS